MATQPAVDQAKQAAFVQKVVADGAGAFAWLLCAVGDRLGLLRDLADRGPATSAELAARTGLQERYLREWLHGLACAGYLEYDPASRRFALPAEHAPMLAQEAGFAGFFEEFPSLVGVLDPLLDAFRRGGGVPLAAYDAHMFRGDERLSAGYYEGYLVQEWVPALPGVPAALERGALVADVGCGGGRALLTLARAFPASRFVGYDAHGPNVARATAAAEAAGVADRVRFKQRDIAAGLPEQYDLITAVFVVHDAGDPAAVLRAVRSALRPGGAFLCVEGVSSERLEERLGPMGALSYGASLFYCLPTALAQGEAGLGNQGLPEPTLRDLCAAAGFGAVRRVPVQPPVLALYEVMP